MNRYEVLVKLINWTPFDFDNNYMVNNSSVIELNMSFHDT